MNNAHTAVIAAATLAVGATFGYFIPRTAAPSGDTTPSADSEELAKLREHSGRLSDELESLRAENIRQQNEIAAMKKAAEAETDSPTDNATENAAETAQDGDSTTSESKITVSENGKVRTVTNPEEIKKIKESLDSIFKRAADTLSAKDSKADFLEEIDTDWMSEEELAVHNRLLGLIQKKKDLDRQLVANIFSKKSDNNAKFDITEQIKLDADMKDACEQERDMLLRRTANLLGLSNDDSAALVSTVKDICNATTRENTVTTHTIAVDADELGSGLECISAGMGSVSIDGVGGAFAGKLEVATEPENHPEQEPAAQD